MHTYTLEEVIMVFSEIHSMLDYTDYEEHTFDVIPLPKEDYEKAQTFLGKANTIASLWIAGRLPNNIDNALKRAFINYDEYDPDIKDAGEYLYSDHERYIHWSTRKRCLADMVVSAMEHIALRRCADEANKVAHAIGRPGVRIYFQGSGSARIEEECDYHPGGLESFAKFVTE